MLGDDPIKSLKEAVDHAKREGSGIVHTLGSARYPEGDNAKSDVTADGSDPVGPPEPQ